MVEWCKKHFYDEAIVGFKFNEGELSLKDMNNLPSCNSMNWRTHFASCVGWPSTIKKIGPEALTRSLFRNSMKTFAVTRAFVSMKRICPCGLTAEIILTPNRAPALETIGV